MSDAITYDAGVYQTEVYRGRQVTTYWVRWKADGRLWREAFRTVAQADSFRSALLTAARKGAADNVILPPQVWEEDSRRSHDPPNDKDWGELNIRSAMPDAGSDWTDDGSPREKRQLKHRAEGDSRIVPTHPGLTRLLRDHLAGFGTAPDGRLFGGVRGGELSTITYRCAWIKARQLALTAQEQASPLARRPYDLRHACLSTWLNGGVYPTQVAEWAGHGVDVLLRIYAKCIVGQDELAKRRISEALRQV